MTAVKADASSARRGLSDLLAGVHQAASLALRTAEEASVASAKGTDRFKDRTGATRASIRAEVRPGLRGFVSAGGASRFLQYGTRAHDIVARNASALRFEVAGAVLFRRMVHHPGTAPRPFLTEARNVGERAGFETAEYLLDYAIRKA